MVYLLPARLHSHTGLDAPLTAPKFQLYLNLIFAQEQPSKASTAIWDVDQHIQVSGQRNMGGGMAYRVAGKEIKSKGEADTVF